MPHWSMTAASLVGAGMAIGFGLFATRHRWMAQAEELNDRLMDRWHDFSERHAADADAIDDNDEHWGDQTDVPSTTVRSDSSFAGQ
jgi:hypothetical protein